MKSKKYSYIKNYSYFSKNRRKVCIILFYTAFIFFLPLSIISQTTTYNQFNNEFQLNRAISDKWALELDLDNNFSSTPEENRIFKTLVQGYGMFWGHYYLTPRWKISNSIFYYYNHDAPEIGQYDSQEWRYGLQAIYYFNKIKYTLSAKMRGEVRFTTNQQGNYEVAYRYRQMLRYLKPINSQVLRKGVFYALATDELFFRSISKNTGWRYFDRNIFSIGGGYLISDDLQLEITYNHEFAPRDDGNTLTNQIVFTFITSNLISNLSKKITGLFIEPDDEE